MNNSDVDRLVYRAIGKKPILFEDIGQCIAGQQYYGYLSPDRALDRSLQRLRKARKIRYLKHVNGGPGWVRT